MGVPAMMRAGMTPPNKGRRYPAEVLEPAEVQALLDQLSRRSTTGIRNRALVVLSGRLTSDDVTQHRLDIRGCIDTARKHGIGAYEVMHQLMLGNP